jgi:D-alanyl-lipoteichoic acid acyltransferase DltB (MBOAT superfamily)
MTFNSFTFIFLFLPIVVTGYFLLGRGANRTWPKVWLLIVSLFFFATNGVEDLPLLLGSLAVNYLIARRLVNGCRMLMLSHRALLITAVSLNILFLCYFKYAVFFLQTFNHLLGTNVIVPHSSFPLGISFYTIYQTMFLVDCYEGLVEKHNWLDHFVFGSLFPYVTMGPIVRWKQIVPQLNDPETRHASPDNMAKGLFVFVVGLFKKVVLANTFFRWADAGFSYNHPLSLVGGWIAALAFTFQLYFDFSGYTDMAVGAGLLLNLNLPQNFNAPIRSQSIIDFWRRWHITLTNFITTYLYTPMIRSMARVTFGKAMVATFLAMVIAGFWHGANWTFIIFGALHGAALVVNQYWRKLKWPIPGPLAWLATFVLVVVSFVFFKSNSVSQAMHIVTSMFTFQGALFSYDPWTGIDRVDQILGIAWMLLGVAILFRAPSSMELQRTFKPSWSTVVLAVALAAVACIYANGIVSRSFVYRDF